MSVNEDSSDDRLDRQDYPYFTEDEFNTFRVHGKQFVEKVHLSCKIRYEKRIKQYSLDSDEGKNLDSDEGKNLGKYLNIVICGKTGSGKSSTANAILGRKAFQVDKSSNSVTKASLATTCTYKNRKITVVDTPGIHDTESDKAVVKEQLARIAFLLKNGVHCFIICISAGESRFTKELIEMLELIKLDGQGNFFDHCMLAYTKAEAALETCTLREFLKKKKENEHNRCFLESIKDRVVAVNNDCLVPAEALRNRDALINMVDVVVMNNMNNVFTVSLFQAAGNLHETLTSVVQHNNFHPGLVNAVTEVVIQNNTSNLSEFVEEVLKFLIQSDYGEDISQIANQIKQIYVEIQPDLNTFMKILTATTVSAFSAVLASAAGVGVVAAVVVGSTLGIISCLLALSNDINRPSLHRT